MIYTLGKLDLPFLTVLFGITGCLLLCRQTCVLLLLVSSASRLASKSVSPPSPSTLARTMAALWLAASKRLPSLSGLGRIFAAGRFSTEAVAAVNVAHDESSFLVNIQKYFDDVWR